MGPDLTEAYFWHTVNKGPAHLWPGYFLTRPNEIFLTQREENWKILNLKVKFSKPRGGWPDPTQNDLPWPGSKIFDLDPSLLFKVWLLKWLILRPSFRLKGKDLAYMLNKKGPKILNTSCDKIYYFTSWNKILN